MLRDGGDGLDQDGEGRSWENFHALFGLAHAEQVVEDFRAGLYD
jgi:hypothetical protein